MYFAIYDRWGQKVFDTKNQKVGWDGTFKGKAMEPSVFSYYLDVKCIGGETYIGKGNITLIK
jgi:gliding motility-associated-like protein